ncbi:MAG: hypothetical protein K9L17_02505 [Clostridiales bacterium]|nr:hypothetical protein [Clostridiales bacterium]MCF8021550.1 hypothetical protein [Clostridiales bacterium]
MEAQIYQIGEVVLYFPGNDGIPAVGPIYKKKGDAVCAIKKYLNLIKYLGINHSSNRCGVKFIRQDDGRYTLVLINGEKSLETLKDLDEIMLKRFRKSLQKKFFVVTSFYTSEVGEIECLAVTDGLGAILFAIN